MPARRTILVLVAVATLIAGCGGSSSSSTTPKAPSTSARTRPAANTPPPGQAASAPTTADVTALMGAPCGMLSDADIAPIGTPVAPGATVGKPSASGAVTPEVITRDGIATSRCRWDMPGGAYLEAELYLLSGYASPQDYAKQSLAHWADVGKAASQAVPGIGDFAGLVVPSQHDTQTVAIFFAQKGTVAISVYFAGPPDAPWPTAPQLQTLGAAAAARVF